MTATAVVTGGAGGIGAAIVRHLLEDSVVERVVAVDLAARMVPGEDSRVEVLECDVRDEMSVRKVLGNLGPVNVLVNNAGGGRIVDLSPGSDPLNPFGSIDHWREVVDLNLTSAHLVTSVVGPQMVQGSSICNTTSVAGIMNSHFFAYAAAKAGLIHWTRSLAVALAPKGIRVNAVAPGFCYTRLWEELATPEMFDAMVQDLVPMGSQQTPDDIAAAVVFLCSPKAKEITGQTLAVDGGATAGRPSPGS